MTIERLKEIAGGILVLLIPCSFIGGCIYFVSRENQEEPPKANTQCSELIYYNKSKNSIDTTYTEAYFFGDSLLSFKVQANTIWIRKQFLTFEVKEIDYGHQVDLTVNGGDRFRLTPIDSGGCKIKSKMDSIKNQLSTDDEPDDDNN